MHQPPLVSVVLGSYNRCELLKLTIESVRKELDSTAFEIIVVDGGSDDGSVAWLSSQKDVVTIVQHNRGEWRGRKIERRSWGYFMNLGFKAAQGKYVCMISDDCLIVPGAIKNGIAHAEQKIRSGEKIGAVAFYWRDWPNQEKYKVGLTLGDKMFVNHGFYLKAALEEVGYIDEENFAFYCADGDLVLKMWHKGYFCIDSPDSYVEHFAHTDKEVRKSNLDLRDADWKKYLDKWKGIFYDEENNNAGGWIEKEFRDPDATWKHFRPFYSEGGLLGRIKHKLSGK